MKIVQKNRYSRRTFLQMMGTGAATVAAATCLPAVSSANVAAQSADTGSAPTVEAKYVEYWTGWRDLEFEELANLTGRFNEEQDEIAVTMYHAYDGADQLWEAVSAGNPPDVVSAIELNQLVDMAGSGTIQPLSEYAIADKVQPDDYLPQLWNSWLWREEIWCLMLTANTNVIGYNTDIFGEAKLDFPKTIDELDKTAIALDEFDAKGDISRAGFLPHDIYFWGQVFGGNFYDPATDKITADSDEIVEALEWIDSYQNRIGVDKIDKFIGSFGYYSSAENSFFIGQEAMIQTGEWFTLFQEYFAPDMNMGMAAAPAPKTGRANYSTISGSIFTIPTGAYDPDASWALIKWLHEDEQMTEFCTQIQNIPAKAGPASAKLFTENPRFRQALELLNSENVAGPDKMPVNKFLIESLYDAEFKVLNTQLNARKALEQVNDIVQERLDRTWEAWEL